MAEAFYAKGMSWREPGSSTTMQAIAAPLAGDYPEPREWLSNSFVREGLRQVCNLTRAELVRRKIALTLERTPGPLCGMRADQFG